MFLISSVVFFVFFRLSMAWVSHKHFEDGSVYGHPVNILEIELSILDNIIF